MANSTHRGDTARRNIRGEDTNMAGIITLDALKSLIAAEPESVTRTRSITVVRLGKLRAIVADANAMFDVSDEAKSDGTALNPGSIKSAYSKLIKEHEMSENVAVRKFSTGQVVIAAPEVLFPDGQNDTDDENDDDENDESN
jgi:hypothetical protein